MSKIVYCEECKYWAEREHQARLVHTLCRGECLLPGRSAPTSGGGVKMYITNAKDSCQDGVVFSEEAG